MLTGKRVYYLTIIVFFFIIGVIWFMNAKSLKNYTIESARTNLMVQTRTVRDCLARHTESATPQSLGKCLKSFREHPELRDIWIARSQSLIAQYGEEGFLTRPADAVDRSVLHSGRENVKILQTEGQTPQIRITVPFLLSSIDSDSCIRCHEGVEGDVLGTFSTTFDLSDQMQRLWHWLYDQALMLAVATAALLGFLFLILSPYRRFLSRLEGSLDRADKGDFTAPLKLSSSVRELKDATQKYNRLLDIFEKSIEAITQRFSRLIKDLDIEAGHPLEQITKALHKLAYAYHFKQKLEQDSTIFDVYSDLVALVRNVTHAEHFSIYSIDRKEQTKSLVYSTVAEAMQNDESGTHHSEMDEEIALFDDIVYEFPSLMAEGKGNIAFYYCIPIDIDENQTIVIALFAQNRKDMESYRASVLSLKYYLENAKPVIESKLLAQKLREQSLLDGLTGLYNRKFLEEFIDKIDNQAKRSRTHYAVLMLDIDFFKQVNDTYGHDVGDQFIKMLGHIIKNHIRSSDIAVRYGGEEFLILLHESSREGAIKVAETIRKSFAKTAVYVKGKAVRKTLSIGISLFPDTYTSSLREAIKHADIALYKAKEAGRDQIAFFELSMLDRNINREVTK
jgi:two-component system cell cycle response regulator